MPPSAPMEPATYLALVARLESLAQILSANPASPDPADEWKEAEGHLKTIADGLREEALRKPLAQSSLPSLLSTFLRLSVFIPPLSSSSTSQATTAEEDPAPADLTQSIETLAVVQAAKVEADGWKNETSVTQVKLSEQREGVIREVGRLAANMVFDDDENRAILMTYQYPASVFQILSTYLCTSSPYTTSNITTLRALVASLLNCAMAEEYDAIKLFILQEPILKILLGLANKLYTPCEALKEGVVEEGLEEKAGVAGWLWRILEESMDAEDAAKKIGVTTIPLLLSPFPHFPSATTSSTGASALAPALSKTDLQILTSASQTLQGLSIDRPDLLTAFLPHLRDITSFIHNAGPPAAWFPETEEEDQPVSPVSAVSGDEKPVTSPREKADKAIGLCKACMMKVVVEVCGECDVKEEWFWEMLKDWIKGEKDAKGEREDLISCALLCYGNYARSEQASASLLASNTSILPAILPLIAPATEAKVQHALLGLLKNLSIPAANKIILGEAGVAGKLVEMKTLAPERDMLQSIQGGAVGVLKHLVAGNVPNCKSVIPAGSLADETSTLSQLLALISRSDDLGIRCEATRIFVNIIKTLFSSSITADAKASEDEEVEEVKEVMASDKVVKTLFGMIEVGGKYSVLIGEGVLALNLLCRSTSGAGTVAELTLANITTLLNYLLPLPESENPPLPTQIKSNIYLLLITVRKSPGVEGMPGFEEAKKAVGEAAVKGAGVPAEAQLMAVVGKAWA